MAVAATGGAASQRTVGRSHADRFLANDDAHWWDGFGDHAQNGFNQPVNALTVYNGELIAAGDFWYAGGVWASCIARWDGNAWHPLGGGLDSEWTGGNWPWVRDVVAYRGDLIAGGRFRFANGYVGGTRVNNIARWDGTRWYPMGAGTNSIVTQLAVYNDDLIVAGHFTEAGGVPVNYIARWDGTAWHPLGQGPGGDAHGFVVYRGDLVAALASGIVRWNGSEWSRIGTRQAHYNTDIEVYNDTLVANMIHLVDGFEYPLVSRWDGSDWQPLASGLAAYVGQAFEFAVYNGHLYAGGSFLGRSFDLNRIARWDGTTFVPLGSGVRGDLHDGAVRDFVVHDGSLYVGGRFQTAGGRPSWYIARWDDVITPVLVEDLAAGRSGDAVHLAWRLSREALRDVRGVHVERAGSRGGPYEERTAAALLPERVMAFADTGAPTGDSWWYRLGVVLHSGERVVVGPVEARSGAGSAGILLQVAADASADRPIRIRYAIRGSGTRVQLGIFSVTGRAVRVLERGYATPGEHVVSWDRRSDAGAAVARGAYIVRLATDRGSASRKLLVLHR